TFASQGGTLGPGELRPASAVVADERLRDEEVDESDHEDDEEKQPRHRRRAAEVPVAPAEVVEVQRDREPLVRGSALSELVEHAGLLEDLQPADRRRDDDEDEGGLERGQRDRPEL